MRHVFITGITGVVGSAIAPILLRDSKTVLHVLIRGKDQVHAEKKLLDLIDYWAEEVDASSHSQIQLYWGDASKEKFGLTAQQYQFLLDNITHIIHSAASVKLDMSPVEAQELVLAPSDNILEFALALHKVQRLRKLEYISTLGVAGKRLASIPEAKFETNNYHNNYERYKAISESNAIQAFETFGIPLTIHRPSMIVGSSKNGKIIHFQGFYFLCKFLSGKQTFGFLPALPKVYFDLIPSDYVARAIACSLQDEKETIGRILHLCSGQELSISYLDLIKFIRTYNQRKRRNVSKITLINPDCFLLGLRLLAFISFNGQLKKSVKLIANYFKHIETEQSFENRNTRLFLQKHEINLEYPENYLAKILDYRFTGKILPM